MRVVTHGALSVISAFATGIGSAVGIDQPMEVTFDGQYASNSLMIKKTISFLNRRFHRFYLPGINVKSEIPEAAGFKTSSALTGAIVCGYLHHFDIDLKDVASITAECSRANGSSITGALDDAVACLHGGLSLTDNSADRIILNRRVQKSSVIIAWPTNRKRNTVKIVNSDLTVYSPSIERLRRIVEHRDFKDAMVINGMVYGMHFGLDRKVIRYFLSKGASHCSGTGKGPGIFAFFDDPVGGRRAMKEFSFKNYKVRETTLSNTRYRVVE